MKGCHDADACLRALGVSELCERALRVGYAEVESSDYDISYDFIRLGLAYVEARNELTVLEGRLAASGDWPFAPVLNQKF